MAIPSKENIGMKNGRKNNKKNNPTDHKMALVLDKSGSGATGRHADFGKVFGSVKKKKREAMSGC